MHCKLFFVVYDETYACSFEANKLQSANFPNNYNNNLELYSYELQTSPGYKIAVKFVAFNLEASSSCRWDYLEIYEGDSLSLLAVSFLMPGNKEF